jgi:hypothetical protein
LSNQRNRWCCIDSLNRQRKSDKSYKRECPEKTAPPRLNAFLFSAFSPTE